MLRDSIEKDEDFTTLLSQINVRKTFEVNDMQLWVMQHLGGRELISKINYQDANTLHKNIKDAIQQYKRLEKLPIAIIKNKV